MKEEDKNLKGKDILEKLKKQKGVEQHLNYQGLCKEIHEQDNKRD